MKKLGHVQSIQYELYLNCRERTKRNTGLLQERQVEDDQKLIRFILENSSIVERGGERAFRNVGNAIDVICKQLCPGQWCTRSHCKEYGLRFAYHCSKTRPAVCKEYKKYIDKQQAKKEEVNNKKVKYE